MQCLTSIFLPQQVNGYADCGEQIPSTGESVSRYGMKLVEVVEKVAAIVKRSMPLVRFGVAEDHQWRLPNVTPCDSRT